jgi:hypothetical protein
MERHRRTVRSSVVEILLLSKSPTPIGMPTTIDPYCSGWEHLVDPKAVISHMFIPDLNAGRRDSEMSVQASPSRDPKNKKEREAWAAEPNGQGLLASEFLPIAK